MAISYEEVGWDPSKYFGPTNMNHMDDGIKAACDGVDKLTTDIGTADLSKIGDGTVMGAVVQNAKDIEEVNSNFKWMQHTAEICLWYALHQCMSNAFRR